MKPTVRRLGRLALLAIFCFGVALGVGAYLFALIFAVEAAACHDLSSLDEMRRHAAWLTAGRFSFHCIFLLEISGLSVASPPLPVAREVGRQHFASNL